MHFLTKLRCHRKQPTTHICSLKRDDQNLTFEDYKENHKYLAYIRNTWLRMALISPQNKRYRTFYRSCSAIYFERKRQLESKYIYIIHPFSAFRFWWDNVMILIFLISLLMIPIFMVDVLTREHTEPIFEFRNFVLFMCDVMCCIDIAVSCFTGYENYGTSQVYLSPWVIFRYYNKHGNFALDVITSTPYQLIRHIMPVAKDFNFALILLSIIKGYRARRLVKYCTRLPLNWDINVVHFQLIFYIGMALFMLHWAACVFLMVPYIVSHLEIEERTWLDMEELRDSSAFNQYSHALFAATASFLCIRYTNKPTEGSADTIMLVTTYVFGYIMCILLFVVIFQIVLSHNTPATKYASIMNQLNQYMRHSQLPISLQHRLIQYYGHKFRKTYFREAAILPLLSERLQVEINLHCYTTLVENVAILHNLPDHIVSEVVTSLKEEVFLPNDIIIKAGTAGDSMYFIASGTVAISTPTGKEVCHLQDGAYFGEVALIKKDQRRMANVIAIEICEVYKLDRKTFKSCLATQPEVLKKLEKISQDRVNRTTFLEELHKKHLLERTLARKHEMID